MEYNSNNIIKLNNYLIKYRYYTKILIKIVKHVICCFSSFINIHYTSKTDVFKNKINILIGYVEQFNNMVSKMNYNLGHNKEIYFLEDFIYKNIIIKKANLIMENAYKPDIKLSCNINEKVVVDNNINFYAFFSLNDYIIFANEPNTRYKIVNITLHSIELDKLKSKKSSNVVVYVYNSITSILKNVINFNYIQEYKTYYSYIKLDYVNTILTTM